MRQPSRPAHSSLHDSDQTPANAADAHVDQAEKIFPIAAYHFVHRWAPKVYTFHPRSDYSPCLLRLLPKPVLDIHSIKQARNLSAIIEHPYFDRRGPSPLPVQSKCFSHRKVPSSSFLWLVLSHKLNASACTTTWHPTPSEP